MKKKTALLMCFVLLLTGLFAGCGQKTQETTTLPPEQTTENTTGRAGENTPEVSTEEMTEEVTEEASTRPPFSLYGDEAMGLLKQVEDNGGLYTVAGKVMNGAGQVVMELPGSNEPTYIRDAITGRTRAFTLTVGALETAEGDEYYYGGPTWDYLYDRSGKLLCDRPSTWGYQSFGDWMLEYSPYIAGDTGCCLVDIRDDSIVLENVRNHDIRDFAMLAISGDTLYVYDKNYRLTGTVENVDYAYFCDPGYIQCYGKDGLCSFLDLYCSVLQMPFTYENEGLVAGSYLVAYDEWVAYTAYDGPRMKHVYSGEIIAFPDYPDCTIQCVYGDQVILGRPWDYPGTDRYLLVEFDGTVLTPWFQWLNGNTHSAAGVMYYNGGFANGESVWFFPDRTEIFRCTENDGVYIEVLTPELFAVTGYGSWADEVYEPGFARVHKIGRDEPVIPTGKYESVATGTYWGDTTLETHLIGSRRGVSGMLLYDVMDLEGNIILKDLRAVSGDDERMVIEKGFFRGLVDAEGDWIYKVSAFGIVDEEY